MAVIAVINIVVPNKAFSESENRVLTAMPEFSWNALVSGSFTEGFEDFITDQFPARDMWVSIKTASELALLKKDSGGVYIADDGYLIDMFSEVDMERYEKNLGYLLTFNENVNRRFNIGVTTMLVPTASHILADKLPNHTPEIDPNALIAMAKGKGIDVVDASAALTEHKEEYIYYKTDHHWTSLGAYYAYVFLCGSLAKTPIPYEAFKQEVLTKGFYGTSYSRASLYSAKPDAITVFRAPYDFNVVYNLGESESLGLYERKYLDVKDKYSVFLNANQPLSVITGGEKNGRHLLLIKDSYANTFAQFIAGDYESVHMIDLRYYKMPLLEYMEGAGITDVLVLYNIKNFAGDKDLYALGNGK